MNKFLFKNIFDYLVAIFSLPIVFPIVALCWIVASIETKSNGLFFQERIGRYGKPFWVIKIKTMYNAKNDFHRSSITSEVAGSITRSGHFFRKYKLDELPQIINIVLGKMSFVGPRPDVSGYADKLVGDDRIVLRLKPGITGPASLKYRDEELILSNQNNPKLYNDTVIWPDKVRINKNYYMNYSFNKDIFYILKTIVG